MPIFYIRDSRIANDIRPFHLKNTQERNQVPLILIDRANLGSTLLSETCRKESPNQCEKGKSRQNPIYPNNKEKRLIQLPEFAVF